MFFTELNVNVVSGLKFVNVPYKSIQRWNWDNSSNAEVHLAM
jgi:hypothetical protein